MSDETYIRRAIQIAHHGLGSARPNPSVGAVIVCNNMIIGEGFTSAYGGPHAEVNAINSVKDRSLLKDSTIYVTLEPCSHYGKTPPCSDLIIKNGIKNVVIGCIDDNEAVAGKGIKKLRDAHCNVKVGVLESECKQLHKRFFSFHNKKRPYIILKWAQSNDGFLSPETKDTQKPVWISNAYSKTLVHKWRAEEQAILVGTNTVNTDNPSLTTRQYKGYNPTRIILDRNLTLNQDLNVFNTESSTIVITSKDVITKNGRATNVILEPINWSQKDSIAKQISSVLFKHNINSVIIEGGAQTLQTFINENLWDEARIFTGTIEFKNGITGPKIKGELISSQHIKDDRLAIFKNS